MKNNMIKNVFTVLVGLFLSVSVFAQYTASEQKSIDKSVKLYNAAKYDKAISTLIKVQLNHPFDEKLWNYRVAYESDRYTAEYTKVLITIIKQASAGKTIKVNQDKMNSDKIEMLSACFHATMFSEKQEQASSILRTYYVDPTVDTAIGEDAKDHYNEGDKAFNDQDWTGAIKEYKKAVGIDSNYFDATYSIGLSYFKNSDYDQAIPWFQHAIRIEPGLANTYNSLAECYVQLKQWENAKNACIDGILVYPEYIFFDKLETIADKLGKTFDRHWQERLVSPNSMGVTGSTISTTPWQYYVPALDKISDNCNEDGVVTKQPGFTDAKYLESYSWEFMLKKSNPDDEKDYQEMAFARKMQTAGFLDCYAFISCYHINLQSQYKDFSKHNADRIRTYINTYLIK